MPTNIKIIQAHDFVRTTTDGRLDFETSRKALIEIALATTNLVRFEILLDTRKSEVQMSVIDLWYLASELTKHRETYKHKTAVLCPTERFDQAEFFALCSQNQGLNVRAFTSFEEAISWLMGIGVDG